MRLMILTLAVFMTSAVHGADFEKLNLPTTADISKIFFYNDQMGWVATSEGEVLSTYDSGKNWRKVDVTKRRITDIHFFNRAGYIVGDRGLLMKSTNGGGTWQDISLNIKYNFTGVGIADDSSVVICGTDQNSMSKTKGEIFESRDHGKTWKKHPWRLGNGFTDLAVYPPRKIYLLAIKKAFHSTSAGIRYFPGEYEGSRLGLGIDFIDDWGYLVGYKGLFGYSFTHGRRWKLIELELETNLYAVEMFDKYSGVAVGEDGVVMNFYEEGERQVIGNCGHKVDLRTVCVTSDRIYIGGDDGLMMVKERFPRSEKQP